MLALSLRQMKVQAEHDFGTIKARMDASHFLMKTLPKVAAEMALHVLLYNMTRAMSIVRARPLLAAMRAQPSPACGGYRYGAGLRLFWHDQDPFRPFRAIDRGILPRIFVHRNISNDNPLI